MISSSATWPDIEPRALRGFSTASSMFVESSRLKSLFPNFRGATDGIELSIGSTGAALVLRKEGLAATTGAETGVAASTAGADTLATFAPSFFGILGAGTSATTASGSAGVVTSAVAFAFDARLGVIAGFALLSSGTAAFFALTFLVGSAGTSTLDSVCLRREGLAAAGVTISGVRFSSTGFLVLGMVLFCRWLQPTQAVILGFQK